LDIQEFDLPEKRQELLANDALIILRFGEVNHKLVKKEILYNQNFLSMIDYDIETMINTTLNDGVPEIYPAEVMNEDRFRTLIMNIFKPKMINIMSECQTEILTKNSYRRPVVEKLYGFSHYNKETGYEVDIVFAFKEILDKPVTLIQPMERNPIRMEELESKEKDIQTFMKKFYGQNYIGNLYNSKKVCKIRKL